jgi:sugar lactone lactonase YvrE
MITLMRHGGHRARPVRPGLRAVMLVTAAAVMLPAAAAAMPAAAATLAAASATGPSRGRAAHGTAATSWVISSVAGGVGPSGPATSVAVNFPCGLAVAAGNLFIADRAEFRKVSSTGLQTTLAGTGDAGPFQDGGLAGRTSVGGCGLAVDHSGNLVVTDAGHNMIRVVPAKSGTFYGRPMAAGHIYTIAGDGAGGFSGDGGPATAAELSSPEAVRLDAAGNLVISDSGNNRLRVVAERTGTFYGQPMTAGDIYTVAGGGTAQPGDGGPATDALLAGPAGLAVDATGNLVFADTNEYRVQVVAASNGTFYGQPMTAGDIYTVAGNGQYAFGGDGGPAVNAKLAVPNDVAVDHAGNLVIADTGNHRVRVVAASTGTFYGQPMTAGDIYTVAGSHFSGFSGDGGPATAARLDQPWAVKVDGAGNVLIGDAYNERVRVVAASTGTFYGQPMTAGDIYTVAGNGTLGYSGDGHPALQAQIYYPQAVAVDPAGNVVIADTDNERIRVVAASNGTFYGQPMTAGHIYTVAGTGTSGYGGDGGPAAQAKVKLPFGVAVDHAGNVLIADSENDRIRVVAATTGRFYGKAMTAGDIYTVAGDGHFGSAGDGGPATKAELWFPAGVSVDATGNLLIADADNSKVRVVAVKTGTFYGVHMTAGDIYTVAGDGGVGYFGDGGPATQAGLNAPFGVAADQAGNAVIADTGNNVIRVVAAKTGTFYGKAMTAGDIYTVVGDGYAGFSGDGGPAAKARISSPSQLAVDAAGNLVIAASGNGRIRVVAAKSGTFYGVHMTAGDIYTVAGGAPFGFSGDGGPATKAGIAPGGVALNGVGDLVIADTANYRIRLVSG